MVAETVMEMSFTDSMNIDTQDFHAAVWPKESSKLLGSRPEICICLVPASFCCWWSGGFHVSFYFKYEVLQYAPRSQICWFNWEEGGALYLYRGPG